MTTLYGIKNCDTVRKARRWLDENGVTYSFHDLRSDGLDQQTLQDWEKTLGWEQLLNRRGMTWRRLPAAERDAIDRTHALKLMLDQPAIIKRPLLAVNRQLHVGFSVDAYQDIFG